MLGFLHIIDMIILRYILAVGRFIVRRIRSLACLVFALTMVIMYVAVSKDRTHQEIKMLQRGIVESATRLNINAGSKLTDCLAVMGTDISSKKLKSMSGKFKYLLILPHSTQEILPVLEAPYIDNNDELVLEDIIEFLDSTEEIYHAGTCQIIEQGASAEKRKQDSCQFEKRNWTMVIRQDGTKKSNALSNRVVNFIECNMSEGPFIIRRRIFEKFDFNTDNGDTVLLDFFLRTRGKIKIASLADCSFSEKLHRQDRGVLTNNPFYTDYITLGSRHGIVRIIKKHKIIWTKCSYNLRLCPEKPFPLKYSLIRQLKPVCCSRVLDKLLVDVVRAMEAIRLDYRIEYGTLLGAVRSGTIIPWTKDVDIGLQEDDYFKDRNFNKLKGMLNPKGYSLPVIKGQRRVLPLFPPHHSFNTSVFDKSINTKLFCKKILRTIKSMSRTTTKWQDLGYLDFYIAKKERFESLTTVKINGRVYATMANAKDVLKEWYGQDYMKAVKRRSASIEIDIVKARKRRKNKEKKTTHEIT